MTTTRTVLTFTLCLAVAGTAAAQTMVPVLDLAGATRLGGLAAAEARARDAGGSIAVVDAGGHLLFLERLDRTFPAAAAVSIEKARTAATFRMPTRRFEEAIRSGRQALLGVDVMTPLQGGVPVTVSGQVVGAIGISGAHNAQEDEEIAQAAVTAFDRPPAVPTAGGEVTYLEQGRVAAAFAGGMPLLETTGYKVHASRRVEAGEAEVHARGHRHRLRAQGSVTIVTGGTVVDRREVRPDEIRGSRIEAGRARCRRATSWSCPRCAALVLSGRRDVPLLRRQGVGSGHRGVTR